MLYYTRTKVRSALWTAATVIRHGRPKLLLAFGGGIGDHILCTAVLHELRQRSQKSIWMMSDHKELFSNSPDVDVIVPEDRRYSDLAARLKRPALNLSYTSYVDEGDKDVPPVRHLIRVMCEKAGIVGPIGLRPYMFLSDSEKTSGRIASNQIAIQTSGLAARYPMKNKEWYPERFQQVVNALRSDFTFVQIGSLKDPLLEGAIDLRGRTSIRQSAAVLSQSKVMVGLVGGLMHLARSVDCRAVIIYGGRELPSQSGYVSNENLASSVPCSPCWLRNDCDHDRECMRLIDSSAVLDAVAKQAERYGTPLPVDIHEIK
jgi:hypothetical protein